MPVKLAELVDALNCASTARRRDEAGDWRIEGRSGWIYEQPEGFYLYYNPNSSRAYGFGKKDLSFCEVTLDCDTEGYFRLNRLPTPAEADIIRDRLGIRKRRVLSEVERERLSKTAFKGNAAQH